MKDSWTTPRYTRWTFDDEPAAQSFAAAKEADGSKQVSVKPLVKNSCVVGYSVYWIEESTD